MPDGIPAIAKKAFSRIRNGNFCQSKNPVSQFSIKQSFFRSHQPHVNPENKSNCAEEV